MNTKLTELSNTALLDQLGRLVQHERKATAMLVAHLAEVKKRKLYLGEGYASMFRYCTQALHFSEHAAYLRLEAARMVLQFPAILEALEKGDLNLTTIRLLAPHLTAENLEELIGASRHRTRVEVECLLARMHPRPDVPAIVRRLPARPAVAARTAPVDTASGAPAARLEARAATEPRAVLAPLALERFKVQFTASASTHAKLRHAQDLLRHRIPDGNLSEIFDLALTALVERIEKQKLAATAHPRKGSAIQADSRTIAADVKRAVWKRDAGQCAFIGKNRHRCAETGFLEFHHVVPFARGGAATAANIQLRCRAHNQYEAFLEFGSRANRVRESGASWGSAIVNSV